MVWGGLCLIVTIFLIVAINLRYRAYRIWVLAVFLGTLCLLDQPGDEGSGGEGREDVE
jgi:hypothetical protein